MAYRFKQLLDQIRSVLFDALLNDSQQHLATHFLNVSVDSQRYPCVLSAAVTSAPQPVLHNQQFRDSRSEARTLSRGSWTQSKKKNYAGLLEGV